MDFATQEKSWELSFCQISVTVCLNICNLSAHAHPREWNQTTPCIVSSLWGCLSTTSVPFSSSVSFPSPVQRLVSVDYESQLVLRLACPPLFNDVCFGKTVALRVSQQARCRSSCLNVLPIVDCSPLAQITCCDVNKTPYVSLSSP